MAPLPLSVKAPLVLKFTLLLPAATAPVTVNAPVLVTVISPRPDCAIPVIVNGAPVLIKLIAPPVLVALKLVMVLAPFRVSPPTEFVVNKPPLIKPLPLSDKTPLVVKEIVLVPAAIEPVTDKAPVLFTETLPVPDCTIPVIVNGAPVLMNESAPPLFVAL